MTVSARIKVFEVRRVILEVQNRPQEAPREDKKQQRKRKKQKRPKNKHPEANKSSKNNAFDFKQIVTQWPGGMRGAPSRATTPSLALSW